MQLHNNTQSYVYNVCHIFDMRFVDNESEFTFCHIPTVSDAYRCQNVTTRLDGKAYRTYIIYIVLCKDKKKLHGLRKMHYFS